MMGIFLPSHRRLHFEDFTQQLFDFRKN